MKIPLLYNRKEDREDFHIRGAYFFF